VNEARRSKASESHKTPQCRREQKCADTTGTVLVPGLAISNAKTQIHFSDKIYGSNFIKQRSETVMV